MAVRAIYIYTLFEASVSPAGVKSPAIPGSFAAPQRNPVQKVGE